MSSQLKPQDSNQHNYQFIQDIMEMEDKVVTSSNV